MWVRNMIFESISSKFHLRFKDRTNAGNILAAALNDKIKKDERPYSIVLGIPRGGVVVADIVANKLSCHFDIVVPRKLGAPHNEEVAIGAVMEDGTTYLNEEIVRILEVSKEYIEQEKAKQIQEIKRRTSLYRGSRSYELSNMKNIVLVDDGAATGATVIAAARWIRRRILQKQKPSLHNTGNRLIIAIPVAANDTVDLFKKEADHVEVIITPSTYSFRSVGQYYQSFEQVEDEQVMQIIKSRGLL
jgi:predicted phosphoribosyltransferase